LLGQVHALRLIDCIGWHHNARCHSRAFFDCAALHRAYACLSIAWLRYPDDLARHFKFTLPIMKGVGTLLPVLLGCRILDIWLRSIHIWHPVSTHDIYCYIHDCDGLFLFFLFFVMLFYLVIIWYELHPILTFSKLANILDHSGEPVEFLH